MSGDREHAAAPAFQPVEARRLAAALEELTGRVREQEVRAQLSALSALLGNLGARAVPVEERRPLEADVFAAIDSRDEGALIAAMRRLAALDRSVLAPVDWSAVTRG